MAISLRKYAPADLDVLYEIDRACYPRGIAYSRRMLQWYLALPGCDCLIAEANGPNTGPVTNAIAGFLIADAEGKEGHIITIDVLEAYRREGVGTALLLEAERRLAARGVREVSLETAINNEAGVAFWQRHGYRSLGLIRDYYLGRLDAFAMRKSLAAPAKK